jgi:DNA-binding transcriptional LysR family regulator
MNLAAIDLNLFLVLHAVLEEKSATRAARRLNMTQSAVSNSLARLRVLLKDPLFVRSGRGLVPTPRTRELAPYVESAVAQFQAVLGQDGPFDPAQTTRRFSLACADNSQVCDVPRIVAAMSLRMPRASLRVVSVDYLLAKGGLENADVDASLASSRAAKGMPFIPLYREYGVIIVRRDHPTIRKRVTREIFNAAKHADVVVTLGESGNSRNWFEKFLARRDLRRRVALTVPTFAGAAIVAAQSDYVACIPRRVAEAMARYLPLTIIDLPGRDFFLDVGLVWHRKTDADAGARHFRNVIVAALRDGSIAARGT